MDVALAIVLGCVGGMLGFAPFLVARSRIKARLKTDGMGSIIAGMAAVMASFFVLLVEIVLCRLIDGDYLLPFAVSAIGFFLLAMTLYTVTLMRK